MEANAGSSAGGHFALRLDGWVYDFQNAELGTLRLRRTDYDFFRYLYTVLENRTMHIARVDVPRETREAIFDRFNRRYLIQNKQFSVLDSLHGDRELIRLLLARGSQTASREGEWSGMPIRGAGFFYDGRSEDAKGESPSLRVLRDRLVSDRGPTYLADRISALERAAKRFSPDPEMATGGLLWAGTSDSNPVITSRIATGISRRRSSHSGCSNSSSPRSARTGATLFCSEWRDSKPCENHSRWDAGSCSIPFRQIPISSHNAR